jgi:transcriptional regulator GlxA family with amidase domain
VETQILQQTAVKIGCLTADKLELQRVDRAKQLLKQSQISLNEIALDCGFANQSHLNQHFTKLTGIAPKKYRNCK